MSRAPRADHRREFVRGQVNVADAVETHRPHESSVADQVRELARKLRAPVEQQAD